MAIPKLYTNKESSNSYKARLLPSLLDIKLEHVEPDFMKAQYKSPESHAINTRGKIPVLINGNITLTDSATILTYLAGTCLDRNYTSAQSSYWASD